MILEMHLNDIRRMIDEYDENFSIVPEGYKLKIELRLEKIEPGQIEVSDRTDERILDLELRTSSTLNLPEYVWIPLRNCDIYRVADVFSWIKEQGGGPPSLLKIRGFGPKGYNILRATLQDHGLKLGREWKKNRNDHWEPK